MHIHLIRHTTPAIAAGICYGQADLALANTFSEERLQVLKLLTPPYAKVYSSPLQRCHQLAQYIPSAECIVDPQLMELGFGDWEQRAWNDIPRAESQQWMDDFVNIAPPNGESLLSMQQRVNTFIETIIHPALTTEVNTAQTKSEQNPQHSQHIAIVTHAGVIRLIIAHVQKTPLNDIFQIQLDYGAVVEMSIEMTAEKNTKTNTKTATQRDTQSSPSIAIQFL